MNLIKYKFKKPPYTSKGSFYTNNINIKRYKNFLTWGCFQSITVSNATTANASPSPLFIQQTTYICCDESNSYYCEDSDYGY